MTKPRLCVLCAFDLEPIELITCRACVTDVRKELGRIEASFALLPSLLGHPAVIGFSTVMGVGSEAPLPGGDVLVMLGPASSSTSWRHGDDGGPSGDPGDPPVVAFELSQWCEIWADTRGESSWPVTTEGCLDWLGARLEWASSHHLAFDDFAADMVRIRGRLEAVTGMHDAPEKGASCPYCGTALEREYGPQGRVDDWLCRRCHRAFNDDQYRLALAMVRLAHAEDA